MSSYDSFAKFVLGGVKIWTRT